MTDTVAAPASKLGGKEIFFGGGGAKRYLKKRAKSAKICHFYAKIIKFGIIIMPYKQLVKLTLCFFTSKSTDRLCTASNISQRTRTHWNPWDLHRSNHLCRCVCLAMCFLV